MKPLYIVEAALFSAGRPISVDEIQHESGLRKADIAKALKELEKIYDDRDTVLEVKKAGAKYAMQVRSKAAEPAAKFAPMEIPKKVLKTLTLIAYHQPLKQSELKDMIGSKVYDHVGELKERGLIKSRKDGMTKILTTTATFPEYFGLDAEDPEQIRRVMAKLVGLDPDKDKPRSVESFAALSQPERADGANRGSSAAPDGAADIADATPLEREAAPPGKRSEDDAPVRQVPTTLQVPKEAHEAKADKTIEA